MVLDEREGRLRPSGAADVAERYVRIRRLGGGGMGEVWKAWDRELRRWVALKFLSSADPEEAERFRREARAAGRIRHPNIASVYDVGESEGRPFFAMQYIAGTTLGDLRPVSVRLAVRLIRDAALALHAAHLEGVVHRDIKPANLMVEGDRVYVLDFGLAKQAAATSLSVSGTIVGTPTYMSPEQARGQSRQATPRCDVYGLGATLYDLLTGRPPVESGEVYEVLRRVVEEEPPSLRKLRPDLDPDLEAVVARCLEKDSGRRYPTALALAEDLDCWLAGRPVVARRPNPIGRAVRFVWRRRGGAGISVLLLGAMTAAAVSGARSRRAEEERRREREEHRLREIRRREGEDRARDAFERGRRILERMRLCRRDPGRTDEEIALLAGAAEAEFRRGLEFAPGRAEAHLGIARVRAIAGRREGALEELARAIELAPTFGTAYLDRARLLIEEYESRRRLGRGESADLRTRLAADLDAADRWAADRAERLYATALLAFHREEYAEAVLLLSEHLVSMPEDADGHLWHSHALFHLGRLEEAERAATAALSWHARHAAAATLRGLVRLASGDGRGAVADFSLAVSWRPDLLEARINLGVARAQAGEFRAALEEFDAAVAIDPLWPRAWYNRGKTRFDLADFAGAIADLDVALQLEPGYAIAWNARGSARLRRGDPVEAAIADFTRAIELEPRYADAHLNRGNALREAKRRAEAREDLDRAVQLRPQWPPAYACRARLRLESGDRAGAESDARKALSLGACPGFRRIAEDVLRALGASP